MDSVKYIGMDVHKEAISTRVVNVSRGFGLPADLNRSDSVFHYSFSGQ
jgi:hypothetical protein